MAEHKRVVKSNDFNKGITMHVQRLRIPSTGRSKDSWEGDNRRRRVLEEVLEIHQRKPMMNLDAGLILDPPWIPFVCAKDGSHVTESTTSCRSNSMYVRGTFIVVAHTH